MSDEKAQNLTAILRSAGQGDPQAREQAAGLIYEEIKRSAASLMRSERNVTLQPTALVNEVFLKLLDSRAMSETPDRAYFFAAANRAMRRILIEVSRQRKAIKRGGKAVRHPLEDVMASYDEQGIDVMEFDEALADLEAISPRQAQIVQLRWLMEMTVKEVAELLELSVSTVEQDWRMARAFLRSRLTTQ